MLRKEVDSNCFDDTQLMCIRLSMNNMMEDMSARQSHRTVRLGNLYR